MRYKQTYFEQFIEEATTIQIDYTTFNRIGEEVIVPNNRQPILIPGSLLDDGVLISMNRPDKIIRASRYSSLRGEGKPESSNYDTFLNSLATHTISEATFLKTKAAKKRIATLTGIDKKITEAKKILARHRNLWHGGKFQSFFFESEFFPYFNIPGTQTMAVGINPNFRDGITTEDFFWDLQDAIIYKQRAVKKVIEGLKEQNAIIDENESESKRKQRPLEQQRAKEHLPPKLTRREEVLIHCYQGGPPIKCGQPGYAQYLEFGRQTDRIRYPDESERKARSLIRSIENTYPYLTEPQKRQAENEINTIKANFSDQL